MLNRKGQGLTEYGIILLLILGVGMGVWSSSGISGNVTGIYSTIGNKLQSIIGMLENNYDTDNVYSKNLNRASPTYLTTLALKGVGTILWREEGGKKYDAKTKTWGIDPTYKVYTLDKGKDYNVGGTWGLMINSYKTPEVAESDSKGNPTKYTYVSDGAYASAGYTYDNNCTTTYIRGSDNQIYVVRDYGNMNTTLTNYTGSATDSVTAYTDVARTNSVSTTVGALADARTSAITNNKWTGITLKSS